MCFQEFSGGSSPGKPLILILLRVILVFSIL
jgi:hypothetical protein